MIFWTRGGGEYFQNKIYTLEHFCNKHFLTKSCNKHSCNKHSSNKQSWNKYSCEKYPCNGNSIYLTLICVTSIPVANFLLTNIFIRSIFTNLLESGFSATAHDISRENAIEKKTHHCEWLLISCWIATILFWNISRINFCLTTYQDYIFNE